MVRLKGNAANDPGAPGVRSLLTEVEQKRHKRQGQRTGFQGDRQRHHQQQQQGRLIRWGRGLAGNHQDQPGQNEGEKEHRLIGGIAKGQG